MYLQILHLLCLLLWFGLSNNSFNSNFPCYRIGSTPVVPSHHDAPNFHRLENGNDFLCSWFQWIRYY
ncbi:hypothetical protein GLYMA_05G206750v4 [Glycine max]|nr:hypothetical protein GYH30_013306 [Glycine max]KRH59861.2 hypothetical protein GLYMA_05G206750v4 [Glycine max]